MRQYIVAGVLLCVLPFIADASVIINEVAWMGTANSATDEWIELYSDTGQDLSGWSLSTADGGMDIALSGSISRGGYYLIERTDDTTVPNIPADLVTPFGNGLSNSTETLILKDASGSEVDEVGTVSGAWPGGDNTTKQTMQRSGSAWITAPATPKAANVAFGSRSPSAGVITNPTPGEKNKASKDTVSEAENKDAKQAKAEPTSIAASTTQEAALFNSISEENPPASRQIWRLVGSIGVGSIVAIVVVVLRRRFAV